MYKYLLCWRYLRTRYIALASIISVALGVGTLIVVNSVMSGFTTEMRGRLHSILSDIVIDSRDFGGFKDPEARMEQIREIAGDKIEAMTPTVTVPSMLYFKNKSGEWMSRPVQVIGIDMETYPLVSEFSNYLQHPEHRKKPSFELLEEGYDARDHQLKEGESYVPREALAGSGWKYRRNWARCEKYSRQLNEPGMSTSPNAMTEVRTIGPPNNSTAPYPNYANPGNTATPPGAAIVSDAPTPEILQSPNNPNAAMAADPFAQGNNGFGQNPFEQRDGNQEQVFDPEKRQRPGIIIGMGLISARDHEGRDWFAAVPGDDVNLTIPTTGQPPEAITDSFTVVDFYESKMSEYDSQFVFVPIEYMQRLRGMIDPVDPTRGRVNQIQIKLKPGVDAVAVRNMLQKQFDPRFFSVMTWMDLQGPLLQAVELEGIILNILLFLIIAVAGFGILAIFLMIVIEKTRDIGILKSLGASRVGIMGIFLQYGILLGVVGSGAGVAWGLAMVYNINEVADVIGKIRGQEVFDPAIYYFSSIPTIVDPMMIVQVVGGTLLIAILASIAPALRAAYMHPVEALRHE